MKIAFAGFDLMFSALEALSQKNEIVKLFTCTVDGVYETNTRAIALIERLGIPYTTDRITADDIDDLVNSGCELLVSAGYYHRIPVDDRLPMVNIHPSLLPYGRGAWPMPLAILDGLRESGVTVHVTEESFDTGAILLQRSFAVAEDETLCSFMDKVNSLLPAMMTELTENYAELRQNAREQGRGEYQPEPDPKQYILRPTDDVMYADRILRAFYGFPCYYDDGKELKEIVRCRAYREEISEKGLPLKDGIIRSFNNLAKNVKNS